MYRLDRIGPWPVLDVDLAEFVWPTEWNVNFDNVDSGYASIKPHFRSATVRDDFEQLHVMEGSVALAANQGMTFAIAINGEAENDLPMMYSYHASLCWVMSAPASWQAQIGIGRLDSASVDVNRAATNNNIANPYFLHSDGSDTGSAGVRHEGQVILSDVEADGYGTNPICLFARMVNGENTVMDVGDLCLSLSMFRYTADYDTFDPSR